MRSFMKKLLAICLAAAILAVSCSKTDDGRDDVLYKGEDIRIESITMDDFPFIDCSTSTSPLRDMVMYNLLGLKYEWSINYISGSQYMLQWAMPEGMVIGSDEHKAFASRMLALRRSNGSHGAFVNLIDGATDLIIDSRDISRNEFQYSQEKGVEIETQPLAWDAMVFIVNPANKVKSLTVNQIRRIYTGEITNWKQVGGEDHEIHPYVRDTDSGSQEKMETMVMGGLKMKEWPGMMLSSMFSPYVSIEHDEWGIAYTPYYYCTSIVRDLIRVNVLAVDGVSPDRESILNGADGKKKDAYPFYSCIYAAIRADEPSSSYPHRIYDWLLRSSQAWDIIDESGYIPLRR